MSSSAPARPAQPPPSLHRLPEYCPAHAPAARRRAPTFPSAARLHRRFGTSPVATSCPSLLPFRCSVNVSPLPRADPAPAFVEDPLVVALAHLEACVGRQLAPYRRPDLEPCKVRRR